jgi:hypothetical protein
LVVEWVHRPNFRVYFAVPDRVVIDLDSEITIGRIHKFGGQNSERMPRGIDRRASVDSLECHPNGRFAYVRLVS